MQYRNLGASGLLTGKYSRGNEPPEGTRMAMWGDRARASMSDATSPGQVIANAEAAAWKLTQEEMDEVAELSKR